MRRRGLTGARRIVYRLGVGNGGRRSVLPLERRRRVAGIAAALGASLAAGPFALAAHTLDAASAKAFAGMYAVDCRRPAGVRVRVAADTLAVEQGKKEVASHDVQRATTYSGQTPPVGYDGTLLGDIPGGQSLVLHVFHDARGVYLVVDADTELQAAFGKAALTPKFRSCAAEPGKR
jgi:hypothetical protein